MNHIHSLQRVLLTVLLSWLALAQWSNTSAITHASDPSPPQPRALIDACGTISADTTWSAGNVYTAHFSHFALFGETHSIFLPAVQR